MAKFKFKESGSIVTVLDADNNVIARYEIDYHWIEKNISVKEDSLSVRLYNRSYGYVDCLVELDIPDVVQKIPRK